MHNAALAEMSREDPRYRGWNYSRLEVKPEDLDSALARLHALRFTGLNLTLPHKVLAVASLASIDPAAQPIGAVNTLQWTPSGWRGYNTDGYGLVEGIRSTLGLSLKGAPVLLLGAGGAARGAAVQALQDGCAALWIGNRTRENLDRLLEILRPVAGNTPLIGFASATPPPDLPTGMLVINATSSGLRADDPCPIDLAQVPRVAGVYDMIYNPPETPLLHSARRLGFPAANGLSMLVHQGARALEIWTGRAVPVATMDRAARDALASRP